MAMASEPIAPVALAVGIIALLAQRKFAVPQQELQAWILEAAPAALKCMPQFAFAVYIAVCRERRSRWLGSSRFICISFSFPAGRFRSQ